MAKFCKTIDDLPDEILEYIISLVSPYEDMEACSLVCKRWHQKVQDAIHYLKSEFGRSLSDGGLRWDHLSTLPHIPAISKRYSHSACFHRNSVYVFGGCTASSTTFNDLWRLDLGERRWVRPLAIGTYPCPKACASIIPYKDDLLLFGGWTHPSPYPLHQAWRLYSDLHVYCTINNRWSLIVTEESPPQTAGHSVSIHGTVMVVFGGLQMQPVRGQFINSNDVWCFDIEEQIWWLQETSTKKPSPRYGQSQIQLDEKHLLIIGGCGGPNMVFNDVWLLTMNDGAAWDWQQLLIHNQHWSATHIWCHSAVKVHNKVVILSRMKNQTSMPMSYSAESNISQQCRQSVALPKPPPDNTNVLDRKPQPEREEQSSSGSFRKLQSVPQGPSTSASNSFPDDAAVACSSLDDGSSGSGLVKSRSHPLQRLNARQNRLKQLESLQIAEDRIKRLEAAKKKQAQKPLPKTSLSVHVLDISEALESQSVRWSEPKTLLRPERGPEETILYSLVAAKAELVMFGGIEKDLSAGSESTFRSSVNEQTVTTDSVVNSLHFINLSRSVV